MQRYVVNVSARAVPGAVHGTIIPVAEFLGRNIVYLGKGRRSRRLKGNPVNQTDHVIAGSLN